MSVEALERHATALAAATSASALFGALLEASAVGAPRAGILLLRQGRLRGWGSAGTSAAASTAFRGLDLAAGSGWAAEAIRSEQACSVQASLLASAGEPAALTCLTHPVRAGGRTIALLVAERTPTGPWSPPVLALLATIASLRLELDLARRRAAPPAEETAPAPSAPAAVASSPAPPPVAEPMGLVPVTPAAPRGPADQRRDEARRFARLIASDIRLYNEEGVILGRRQGDLLRRLQDPLTRGREAFVRRFGDLGDEGLRLLHEACVQVLAAGDEALLPFETLRPTRR
jgi:hypothetical protein